MLQQVEDRTLCIRSPGVHRFITGHSAIASTGTGTGTVTNTGARRDTLTQVYVDQRAAHLLASAREAMEHLRTVHMVDGTPFLSRG